jgi:hypothetical protein
VGHLTPITTPLPDRSQASGSTCEFSSCWQESNTCIDLGEGLTDKINRVDQKVDEKFSEVNKKVDEKFSDVNNKVDSLKELVANLALTMEKGFGELKLARALDRVWWLVMSGALLGVMARALKWL